MWKSQLILMANSTFAFSLGYLLAYFTNEVGLTVLGACAGFNAVLYHNIMKFGGYTGGPHWAFGGGVLFTLALGIALAPWYWRSRRLPQPGTIGRLVLLWAVLGAFAQALLQMTASAPGQGNDLDRGATGLGIPTGVQSLFPILGWIGSAVMGMLCAREFLNFAPSPKVRQEWLARLGWIFLIAIVPSFLGAALCIPFYLPDSGSGVIQNTSRSGQFLLFSIPAALFVRPRTEWTPSATPKFGWWLLVALALAFALNRGALARGVPIGFHH